MSRFDADFATVLDAAAAVGNRRVLKTADPEGAARMRREGRLLTDFSGNDYLGLSHHPLLKERAGEWAARWGAGSGASRLVNGTRSIHSAVEERLAGLKGTEAALIFASGWQANASILPALFSGCVQPATVFTDRLIHASLHHGCAAAGVRQVRFRHNDYDHLEELLAARAGEPGRRFIITEGVFSMDGDQADVARLGQIARRHDAFLYLDEAHATGVLGPRGMGLSGLHPGEVDLSMGTFSKGLGSFGAYVAGSRVLCDYLVNACGGFIYSTAPPPSVLGAIDAALDLIPDMDRERSRLSEMADMVRGRFRTAGIDTGLSSTQIVPAIIGESEATLALSAALEDAGILASAIRPPTVPKGTARIRFTLSAAHSDDDVAQMVETVVRLAAR
ncbi:8-amino-7-oxononanoate synthase [Tardibacter chloracetimidivorans]|uniref:8-amino-7-oxononanoate synthase n=1 Tax=Tardibacter chloracetimidivorans TaxID=1921510 RepID=A0A1L3ZRT0_9SPHN|nr:aminotransferase class I/II-fold pyridoxal phosphate-dependent enzyme [Tardibacter chloracetimidivorans]API58336.1 8-amino-7-oxononanoate synthase [Tardibacter chloracetimidivorans]